MLENLASDFAEYMDASLVYFHGNRDFYGLVFFLSSHLSQMQQNELELRRILVHGLQRNFSGRRLANDGFRHFRRTIGRQFSEMLRPAAEVIEESFLDRRARHLMLITDNPEHAFTYLSGLSQKQGRPLRVFRSCDFPDEQREEKSYEVLEKIILAMERGDTCAFHGLEGVYQSLYDLLNQNYLQIRGRVYCTIAVKGESYKRVVHPAFKAVVILN